MEEPKYFTEIHLFDRDNGNTRSLYEHDPVFRKLINLGQATEFVLRYFATPISVQQKNDIARDAGRTAAPDEISLVSHFDKVDEFNKEAAEYSRRITRLLDNSKGKAPQEFYPLADQIIPDVEKLVDRATDYLGWLPGWSDRLVEFSEKVKTVLYDLFVTDEVVRDLVHERASQYALHRGDLDVETIKLFLSEVQALRKADVPDGKKYFDVSVDPAKTLQYLATAEGVPWVMAHKNELGIFFEGLRSGRLYFDASKYAVGDYTFNANHLTHPRRFAVGLTFDEITPDEPLTPEQIKDILTLTNSLVSG